MSDRIESRPIVRRATKSDLPRLGILGSLLVEVHHDFDPLRFLEARTRTPVDYAAFLDTQLSNPDIAVLVADVNGDVLGYTYAGIEGYDYMALRGPAGAIYDIIVDPEYRGRGIGRLLLRAALDFLKARRAPRVVLSTASQNEAAQRLFTSMGFRPTMIEMTRELRPSSEPT